MNNSSKKLQGGYKILDEISYFNALFWNACRSTRSVSRIFWKPHSEVTLSLRLVWQRLVWIGKFASWNQEVQSNSWVAAVLRLSPETASLCPLDVSAVWRVSSVFATSPCFGVCFSCCCGKVWDKALTPGFTDVCVCVTSPLKTKVAHNVMRLSFPTNGSVLLLPGQWTVSLLSWLLHCRTWLGI